MRRFVFNRVEDETGISGTGTVVEGVEFTNGEVAITWVTKTQGVKSTTVYHSLEDCVKIHSHQGRTQLFWLDKKSHYNGQQEEATREDQS